MTQRIFDVVLFGASGAAGESVAHYLADAVCTPRLRWALAGRELAALERLKATLIGRQASPELLVVPEADALRSSVATTRVVIAAAGLGPADSDALLGACAEHGTDYVDLRCESELLLHSAEHYHALAESNGARIIHACGFESLQHDLGAYFAVKALRRRLTLGEQDTLPVVVRGIVQGSAVGSLAGLLGRVRQRAVRGLPLRAAGRTISVLRQRFEYRKPLGLWVLPLLSAEAAVVRRSARVLDVYGPSFAYGHYIGLRRFVQVLRTAAEGVARKWLRAHGPPPGFRVLFEAEAGTHSLRASVSSSQTGDGESAKLLAEAALCLAFDRVLLPQRFGVLTAAVAMGDVLVERLKRAGIAFEEL